MIELTTESEYTLAIEEVKDTEFSITLTQQTSGGGTTLTDNQKAAIEGAKEPSADNVFMTAKDMLLAIQFEPGSFTIPVNSDTQIVIRYTGADDITVTLNNDLKKGKVYTIVQAGAGVVTPEGDTDVVLNYFEGVKTAGQYSLIQFYKVDENVFDVIGGVS